MAENVQDRVLNWWNHGEQDRPCLLVTSSCELDVSEQNTVTLDDYWLNPACHEQRAVRGIVGKRYFGEALPYHYVDFGASALCAMQGCKINYTGLETIWVDTLYGSLEDALGAAVVDSSFTRCVRGTFERVAARLRGRALVGPYCIGSPCDNLAGLVGTDSFLFSLYDEPELLSQALGLQLELWLKEFDRCKAVLKPCGVAPMTGWHGITAPGSTFPIQEDIGYMLGAEHYDRFCLPGIRAMTEAMEYPFFHLDGVGALKHLDLLLGISTLKVIQWQPGEGRMAVAQWYDVVKKILSAGKSCQLYVQPEEVEPLMQNVGATGMLLIVNTGEEQALRLAERFHLEENPISEDLFL